MRCPRCNSTILAPATTCSCAAAPSPPSAAAAGPASGSSSGSPPGALDALVPARNAPALVAYYCGVFSIIPGLGLVLGPVAIVAGIFGIRRASRHPEVRGAAHAWSGVVMGVLFPIVGIVGIGWLISVLSQN
jgi:hypothetical protein